MKEQEQTHRVGGAVVPVQSEPSQVQTETGKQQRLNLAWLHTTTARTLIVSVLLYALFSCYKSSLMGHMIMVREYIAANWYWFVAIVGFVYLCFKIEARVNLRKDRMLQANAEYSKICARNAQIEGWRRTGHSDRMGMWETTTDKYSASTGPEAKAAVSRKHAACADASADAFKRAGRAVNS